MLNKSRSQAVNDTGRRRYDVPGASLRGPYKLWIPQSDGLHSESETEGPNPALLTSPRPRGFQGYTSRAAAASISMTPVSSTLHTNATPQKPHASSGYLSESSARPTPNPPDSKPSSSFSLFKPHTKDSRGYSNGTVRRESTRRSTTAQSAVPSRDTASQAVSIPPKPTLHTTPLQNRVSGSPSTLSSTDPSPRSSTDSGSRGGHVSAPATGYSEARKQNYTAWNPYTDSRADRTSMARKNEAPPALARRNDKATKDKEDIIARVTEALGGSLTTKAKVNETPVVHSQVQVQKREDVDFSKKTTSSNGSRGLEAQAQQVSSSSRRYQAPLQSQTYSAESSLPDKSSRPSTSSRGHVEASSRSHPLAASSAKLLPIRPKAPTAPSTKLPQSRTASSPWPFNQALPPEPIIPHSKTQAHSSSWKQPFTKFQASSQQRTVDSRPPLKEPTLYPPSHGHSDDFGRRQATTSSSVPHQQWIKSSLPSSQSPPTASSAPQRAMPLATLAAISPPETQSRTNASPTTSSLEQYWTPNATPSGTSTVSTISTTSSSDDQQSHITSLTVRPAEVSTATLQAPEPTPPPTIVAPSRRFPIDEAQANVIGNTSQAAPQKSSTSSNAEAQIHGETRPSLPVTTSKYPEQRNNVPPAPETASVAHVRHPSTDTPQASEAPVQVNGRLIPTSITSPFWSTTPRNPDIINIALATSEDDPVSSTGLVVTDSAPTAAGTLTLKNTTETYPTSDYEINDAKELSMAFPRQATHTGTIKPSSSPPRQGGKTSAPDSMPAGAWTMGSTLGNTSSSTFEATSTPKPLPKTPSDSSSSTIIPPEPKLRHVVPNVAVQSQRPAVVPGAWTTTTRYGINNSLIDPTSTSKGSTVTSREMPPRQAILGTTPVAGAWTTKRTSGSGTPSSSEGIAKHSPPTQTPVSNTPVPPSLLKTPSTSGSNTGTNTPSSTQLSDLINQLSPVASHTISTRIPISGHPSTPAPTRPPLHSAPPPLSTSSTSPDTDSLLTPSSLNSPTFAPLSQSQPVATITPLETHVPEKEVAPRKNSFFDFFRKSNTKSYEIWTPPAKQKKDSRDELPNEPVPQPSKTKQTAPVPVPPRPRSPKFFSPFRLFSKRHRTVSSASLDVLDGTATNTMMNSPASSMRADTPGSPPTPPLRDAYLATQEWRNKDAADYVVSGRSRRHRPGVTFDCPEETAPADIPPSRLRITRMHNYDDGF